MENKYELNDDKIFKLYTLAELSYKKHFQIMVESKEKIFPESWYENKNYKEKIEIIKEALKNNVLIENTIKYKESLEGIDKDYVKQKKNQ